VHDAHGAVRGVDALTAGAARPERVHAQVLGVDAQLKLRRTHAHAHAHTHTHTHLKTAQQDQQ